MTNSTKPRTRAARPDSGKPLPQEVAGLLSSRIHGGEWSAGEQLPSERELCDKLGVSRVVIREALASLKSEGLIEVFHGRGAFVTDPSKRKFFEFSSEFDGSDASIENMFELMMTIEVKATRLAAERRTPDELRVMRRALFGMEYAISQGRLGDEEDYSFHKAIVEATHNASFCELSEFLENRFRRIIRQARDNTAKHYNELINAVQQEHQGIFDAIEAQDPDRAAAAAQAHLENALQRLKKYREK